ncbi:MAG: T9SS type A sorting domain-containing protein [Bacteroidia bacterium]|nr:T9SS type A sorting domain-containing protein [Bacteroidia bacterium]
MIFINLLFSKSAIAQPGSIDRSFNPIDKGLGNGFGADMSVTKLITLPNGKTLIAGGFSAYNRIETLSLARVNGDGSFDTTFITEDQGADIRINDLIVLPNQKILMAGRFTTFGNSTINYLVRLNANGVVDNSFKLDTAIKNPISRMALLPNGKLIVCEVRAAPTIFNRNLIRQLNPNGTIDTTFKLVVETNGFVSNIALLPDSKILVSGSFTFIGNVSQNRIARLNSNGSLDTTFNIGEGADNSIFDFHLQPDGKIIIGGDFTSYNRVPRNRLTRLNSDGTLDISFNIGSGLNSSVNDIISQPDGKVLIAGDFNSYNGVPSNCVARLNNDGSIDETFNAGRGNYIPYNKGGAVFTIALQTDGKMMIGGSVANFNRTGRDFFLRLNQNGEVDLFFNKGTGANGAVDAIRIKPDGKIMIAGRFSSYNGIGRNYIARLNEDGTLDSSFNPQTWPNNFLREIELLPDGKMYIVGNFTSIGNRNIRSIARLHEDGTLDTTFDLGLTNFQGINNIELQPDGKIIVNGQFTTLNGVSRINVARINSDASVDLTFNSILPTSNDWFIPYCIQPDGKIVGSANLLFNGIRRFGMVRLNPNGTFDTSFASNNEDVSIQAAVLQPDGKVVVGGQFRFYQGIRNYGIIRLNSNGTIDTSFILFSNTRPFFVQALALQPDGKIIVQRNIISMIEENSIGIERLNSDGSLDSTFNAPASGGIASVVIQRDGKIVIGGSFMSYRNNGRNNITRILTCFPSMGIDTRIACDALQWIDGNIYSTSNNTATYRMEGAAVSGCDSIVTLNLTINKSAVGLHNVVACKQFKWIDGKVYQSSNNQASYNIVGGAANGCDSLVKLNLTIKNVNTTVTIDMSKITANATNGTYQWLNCSQNFEPITGATNQSFEPVVSGNYAVEIRQNDCVDTSICFNFIMTGLTENVHSKNGIMVYPNPFSKEAVVILPIRLNEATLIIENFMGKALTTITNINAQDIPIQRNNLPSGVYILRIEENGKTILLEKVIITD